VILDFTGFLAPQNALILIVFQKHSFFQVLYKLFARKIPDLSAFLAREKARRSQSGKRDRLGRKNAGHEKSGRGCNRFEKSRILCTDNEKTKGGAAMPSGGARKGAGRKPKPLAEKLAEGTPGHRPLKKIEFAGKTKNQIDPPDYLAGMEKRDFMGAAPSPVAIFEDIVRFLEPSKTLHLISPQLLADYALAKYYLICAQHQLSQTAIVGYVSTGKKDEKGKEISELKVTSFTDAMLKLQKNVLQTWEPIWSIVSQNSERLITNPEEEVLLMVMGGRVRRKPKKEDGAYGFPEFAENPGSEAEPGGV
jgi:hypothetical protein